tara:strand:+ start:1750 stop:3786 length:2037 start_codon:yes stop_codon:yes gene_type:complete
MKKIIALIILINIPIVLIIFGSINVSLLHRVENNGYSLQPKDSLWEYVKHEVGEGRVDLEVNYAKKYQEPILLDIQGATKKDRIAVEGLMKDLRKLFPHKTIAYFSDFIGKDFSSYKKDGSYGFNPMLNSKNNRFPSSSEFSYDEILSFTFHLTFSKELDQTITNTTSTNFNSKWMFRDGKVRKKGWNMYYNEPKMTIRFFNVMPSEYNKKCISDLFLGAFWEIHHKNNLLPETDYKFYRIELKIAKIVYGNPFKTNTIGGYIEDKEFLIEKIFSKDFKNKFEDYMYKTYPRRYVNLFIDKEEAKQNATAIVAFMGLLILIISCSLFFNKKFSRSFLSYFWPILIMTLSFKSLSWMYAYFIHQDYGLSSIFGLFFTILFEIVIALLFSFLFWQLEKRITSNKMQFGNQLFIKMGITILFLYIPAIVVYLVVEVLQLEVEPVRELNSLQFIFIVVGLTLGRGLLLYLNHFSDSLVKEKDVELSQLKEANAQAEVKRLQAQINPHFLYNSLNSIAGLAHEDADKTEKMALSLSDLFRYTINRNDENITTVKEELAMVRAYLEIEQIRFGERLQFTIDIQEEVENEQIPRFILQPLIENAVKHGVSKIEGVGKIALKLVKNEKELLLTVSDNGPDFPEGLVCGHGLQTVFDLLRLSYGKKAAINWENRPSKKIEVKLPLKS